MQLTLDFDRPKFDVGKKTERLTITCSTDFKDFVTRLANMQNTTPAELLYKYALEGMRDDMAKVFMPFPHLDKTLRDILI